MVELRTLEANGSAGYSSGEWVGGMLPNFPDTASLSYLT